MIALFESKGVVGGVVSLGLVLFACKLHTADESYRDVAVNNQQLFSRHIELAAQFIGFQSIILNRSWFGSKMDSRNLIRPSAPTPTSSTHLISSQCAGGRDSQTTESAQLIQRESVCARAAEAGGEKQQRGGGERERRGETRKQRPPKNYMQGARRDQYLHGMLLVLFHTHMRVIFFSGRPSWITIIIIIIIIIIN